MGVLDYWRGYPTMSQPLLGPDDVPQWGIPENAPGSLTRPSLLNYQAGPLSQLAYRLAGSPKMKPGAATPLPPAADYSGASGSDTGNAAGVLGTLKEVKQGAQLGQKLQGLLGSDSGISAGEAFGTSASSALGANAAGAIPLFGAGAADLGTIGAGALLGTSGAAATGATAAGAVPLFGAGATDLGGVTAGQLFGTSANAALGSGAAGSAAASGAGTAAAGAGTSALGTIATGAGYGALAIAAGEAIHSMFNAHGDEKRNVASFLASNPDIKTVNYQGAKGVNIPLYAMPDGRLLPLNDLTKLAGAWYGATYAPDGNAGDWQTKYDSLNSSLKTWIPPGYVYKDGKLVRG